MAVGAVMRQPERDPARVAENRTFRPLFALSVGFGPVFAPPKGAFPIAPSAARNAQSIPTTLSYSTRPCRQISWKTPASTHTWNRRCAADEEQIPVVFNAFHCIPVRNTRRIASIASRSGTRGL